MVISVLQFGLGNQLFQYAAGRALADRLRTTLLLDATHFLYLADRNLGLRKLRVRARLLPDWLAKLLTPAGGTAGWKTALKSLGAAGVRTLTDGEQGYDAERLAARRFCRLEGFWQSERYFAHLRPELTEELEPREALPTRVAEFAQRLAGEESVAVHVRRGDLASNPHYAATVGTLGPDYYREALERLQERLGHARVYLFSDDPAWCEQHVPRVFPMEIVSGRVTHSAVEDLTVMKRCRHFVIANSTFGWWGAWLGTQPSKQVIAPASFFREPKAWEKDLLPTSWETVEPAFEENDE